MTRFFNPSVFRPLVLLATMAFAIGLAAVPANASPLVIANKACFFRGIGFTGPSICFDAGPRQSMPAEFLNSVSSIQVIGNVSVSLCTGRVTRGNCMTFTEDRWQVPSPFHNTSKSFQVQRNFSTGTFEQVPLIQVPATRVPAVQLPLVTMQLLVMPSPSN